ncbi:MAG: hypothetical protein WCW03_03465 [Candidatus Paceibacterota bacterium]|jgi:hypothetical protein
MTKNFPVNEHGIVEGTVSTVPSDVYFFTQNGSPAQIFCHRNEGGSLRVTPAGQIVLDQNCDIDLPPIGDKVVLIRGSDRPSDRNFTKALRWAYASDWREVRWAVHAQTVFRATAYDHRNGGHFQGNTGHEVRLAEGRLIDLVNDNPRHQNGRDPLAENYSTSLAGKVLSYKTRWERIDTDGQLTECADPRPVVA